MNVRSLFLDFHIALVNTVHRCEVQTHWTENAQFKCMYMILIRTFHQHATGVHIDLIVQIYYSNRVVTQSTDLACTDLGEFSLGLPRIGKG
jgi:hypothetical protein